MLFPAQNDFNGALDVGVCHVAFYEIVYEYLNLIFDISFQNIVKPSGK